MAASYPASILNWTSRLNSQTVFAADPNTLAAEIDAIEGIIGTNPHLEQSAVQGATTTFATMSARLTSAYLQTGHPYVELSGNGQNVPHSSQNTGLVAAVFGAPSVRTPGTLWPGMVTGSNVIIQAAGVWLINAHVTWDYATSGWVQHVLRNGSGQMRRSVFNYSMFPQSGSNSFGERFINQYGMTETTFVGRLAAGATINVALGNYTVRNPMPIIGINLSAYFLRP